MTNVINRREAIETLISAILIGGLLTILGIFAGCATKTTSVDGTGIQANQYTGLTVFSGSMVSVAQGMEFMDVYEDVSTSWWNFGRYNYKRRTTWASSTSNMPPAEAWSVFAPNVMTEVLYASTNLTNGGSIVSVVEEGKVEAK